VKKSMPRWLVLIAVLQIVPILTFPPEMLKGLSLVVWAIPVILFALIGWGLLTGRVWARTATTFIQGFSVIVRLLSLLPGAVTIVSRSDGTAVTHASLIVTSLISITLSTLILFSVDRPEVTATFGS